MGGTVGVTLRRKDGSIEKMARRTGSYASMFFSKEFAENNIDEAIDNYIKTFKEMKEDYQKGEPYKFNMSPEYGWCNEMAPIDYGLVVIDFKDKIIYSMQEYDLPGTSYFGEFFIQSEKHLSGNLIAENPETKEKLRIFELLKCKPESLRDEIVLILNNDFDYKIAREYLIYDEKLSDFKLMTYDEDLYGLIYFFKDLQEAGFSFNKEELYLWKEFAKNKLETTLEHSEIESEEEIEKLEEEFTKLLACFD